MRDAVRMAIDHVERTAHNDKKVLVLVTEGYDSASTVTQEQLLGMLRNSGVRIYCIGLLNGDDPHQAKPWPHSRWGSLRRHRAAWFTTPGTSQRWGAPLLRLRINYESNSSLPDFFAFQQFFSNQ